MNYFIIYINHKILFYYVVFQHTIKCSYKSGWVLKPVWYYGELTYLIVEPKGLISLEIPPVVFAEKLY
jgi:hypothetical protein